MESNPGNPDGGALERAPAFDTNHALQDLEACNLKLMGLHMKNPFAEVVEKDFSASEPEPPPPGMWVLAKPEPGGEEDIAGRKLLAEKEKMFATMHQEFDADLKRIGLTLIESVKLYRYGNLEISLSDPYEFFSYLERLSESAPTPSQIEGVKKLMTQFYNTLMYGSYGAGGSDEEWVDTLDNEQNHLVVDFLAIKEKFEAVCHKLDPDSSKGLVEIDSNLNVLLDVAKKRYLREYLIAERYNLLTAPGEQFSLAVIHEGILNGSFLYADPEDESSEEQKTHSALANYERIWSDVLKYVRAIKKNENAKELYDAVIKNLMLVLDHIEDDIREEGFEFSKEKRKSALRETIRHTKRALEGLGGDEN